jgi:Fe-S oxidoreductase
MSHTPPDAATQLDHCTYCPKMCRHSCPVSTTDAIESHTPGAKMTTLNLVRKGQGSWDRPSTEPLWACTGCRHCSDYCALGNEPGTTLFAGRAEAVKRGAGHPSLERYPDRFRAREERLAKHAKATFPRDAFAEEAQVALWPGCDALDKGEGDVRAQLQLLRRLGMDHVRLVDADRVCGGYPLLAAGHPDSFRWHATRVAKELTRYRTVVMSCSACVYALRTLYPAEGVTISSEILHIAELLAPMSQRIEPIAAEKPVWYHDPCYLARYVSVTEQPRQVLARVAEVREFGWSHRDTECCGGGGMLPKTMPAVADEMARRRLAEVAEAGGGTVVTSCGTCKHILARSAPMGVEVRDLVEFVEEKSRGR